MSHLHSSIDDAITETSETWPIVNKLPSHLTRRNKNDSQNPTTNDKLSKSFPLEYQAGVIIGIALTLALASPVNLISFQSSNPTRTAVISVAPITSSNFSTTNISSMAMATSYSYSHYQQADSQPQSLSSLQSSSTLLTFLSPVITAIFNTLISYLSWTNIFISLTILSLGYLYHISTRPLIFDRPLSDDEREAALRKSYVDMPPPFPNGWFRLCNDFDVLISQPSYIIDAFDHQFTVSRLSDNSLTCLDELNRLWELCEINRVIFIWHDQQMKSSAWQIPKVNLNQKINAEENSNQSEADKIKNELITDDQKSWRFVGATTHEIICHINEIPENGADTAHLDYLHGDFILDWIRPAKHTWQASWTPQQHPNAHLAKIAIDTKISFWGFQIPGTLVQTRITQVGPGCVQLVFPTPFGNILLQETITSIHANLQRASHVLWCQPHVPIMIAKFIMKSTLIQFERDFIVWNYKRWIRSPLAVKDDGPILKYRRWMAKFFDSDGGKLIRDFDGNEILIPREKPQRE